jgi:5-methylcytosine-specific restriction endonuclease McrA
MALLGILGSSFVVAVILWTFYKVVSAFPTTTRSTTTTRKRQPIPERVRHEVWRRDQGCCINCGSNENLEYDHIIPWSRGGADTVRNLQLLCQTCNRRKGAKI